MAQRGHGLPIGKAAQHYLAARGSSPLWSAVQTFHSLVRGGHQPRCWSLSSIAHAFKDDVSSALHDASSTVGRAPGLAAAAAQIRTMAERATPRMSASTPHQRAAQAQVLPGDKSGHIK